MGSKKPESKDLPNDEKTKRYQDFLKKLIGEEKKKMKQEKDEAPPPEQPKP